MGPNAAGADAEAAAPEAEAELVDDEADDCGFKLEARLPNIGPSELIILAMLNWGGACGAG